MNYLSWISYIYQVDYVVKHKRDLSTYVRECNSLPLSMDFLVPQDDEDNNNDESDGSGSSVVDYDEPMSSGSENNNMMMMSMARIQPPMVRKKRSSGVCLCGRSASHDQDMATNINISRRKRIPHRSPLC